MFEGKIAASNMLKGMTAVPDYTGVQAFQLPSTPSRNSTGSASLNRKRETAASIVGKHNDTSGWSSTYRVGETKREEGDHLQRSPS
ncbi:hypothetical protein [Pseudarthrobacter sp. Y6]|uniref:hypothetical protein n=1 Tax=Pseudarthrobacter sp. Y6 TaxID=3418422 RepID=UPI003CF7176E